MTGDRSSTDPRPRNAQGQYASGTPLGPQDMRRAYGFRLRSLRAMLGRRKDAKHPILSPQDMQRLATLAASARQELIQLEKIGLGSTPEEYPCCPGVSAKPQIRFPRLHIDGTHALPLPKSGKAVIEYRVRSTESHDDAEGNERHSTGLEIQSIEPIEEEAPANDLPGRARQLAAKVSRLVELNAPGATAQAAAGNPLNRRYLALLLRAGRVKAKIVYPHATQRARNAVARTYAQKHGQTTFEASIEALAARTQKLVNFDQPDEQQRVRFVEEGGYTRLVRSDGSKTTIGRAPGLKNRLRRHPVAVAAGAAATAGAGTLALRRALARARGRK